MEYFVVGLGNPGEEYESTRHNVGRMVVENLQERWEANEWRDDKRLRAKVCKAMVGKKDKATLVLPDNYMNRSGASVSPFIKNAKQAERLIVVHDDIDLGLGTIRITFNRGAGGHRGVSSIEKVLKSKAFVRVRIGVVPTTPTGKLRKPKGEDKIYTFILKQLSKKEREAIEVVVAQATLAVESVISDGRMKAMCTFNQQKKSKK